MYLCMEVLVHGTAGCHGEHIGLIDAYSDRYMAL